MARKLGGATVIGVAVGLNGALTLFTPLAARLHLAVFITLRVAIGLAQVRTHSSVFKCQYNLYCFAGFPRPLGTVLKASHRIGVISV